MSVSQSVRIRIFSGMVMAGIAAALAMGPAAARGRNSTLSAAKTCPSKVHVSSLKSASMQGREKAAEAVRKQRSDFIKELLELAAEKVESGPSSNPRLVEYPWHDSKHLSILLLGDLRSLETVPVLLENLEYRNPIRIAGSYFGEGGWFPAAELLWKIGMPAIGPTIKKLGGYDEDGMGRRLCCWVIKKVLGEKLGRMRIEMSIEKSRDRGVKQNLDAALSYFEILGQ